jgi:hypothetical protein
MNGKRAKEDPSLHGYARLGRLTLTEVSVPSAGVRFHVRKAGFREIQCADR